MSSSAQSGKPAEQMLSQAIDRLWARFLPEILQRIAALEEAAVAVAAENLTAPRRKEAEAAAHKLAGVLGTFSLARGTALARELEGTFSSESSLVPGDGDRLTAIAAELRAMAEGRPSSS